MSEQFFPKDKADLFRRQHCKGWTDDQFAEFMHAVERFRLDPMARQIHGVIRTDKKRGQVLAVQCGIDGYRLIADRTGALAGNDDAVFIGGHEAPPSMATVTVYKMVAGTRCPFTASARWAEYCPDGNQAYMWRKMPHVMLGKCAEALALRKAFPAELSGLYTNEEMQQADSAPATAEKPKPTPKPTPPAAPPDIPKLLAAAATCKAISESVNAYMTDANKPLFAARMVEVGKAAIAKSPDIAAAAKVSSYLARLEYLSAEQLAELNEAVGGRVKELEATP